MWGFLTVDPFVDSGSPTKGQSPSLRGLFYTDGVYDVWSCQHANERDYILFSARHHTYSYIDLFVSDKWLLQKNFLLLYPRHYLVRSHCRTGTVDLSFGCATSKLLQEDVTSGAISQYLQYFFAINENSVTDPFILWNAHKAFIRGICIQQGARLKK